jgi:signal transduction histidine kinase/CheY-like chemotaxis protein/integral membrane sensor domain MASE1
MSDKMRSGEKDSRIRRILRLVMPQRPRDGMFLTLSLALAYFFTARLGLEFASIHGSVSPFWPASGLATAALLAGGWRLWPGIVLGAFLANAMSPIDRLPAIALAAALGIAVGNMLEALAATWIKRRVERTSLMHPFEDMSAWLVAAFVAPFVSAFGGICTLWLAGSLPATKMAEVGFTWWAGDAIGILVVGPALLAAWAGRRALVKVRLDWIARFVVLALVAWVVAWWVFQTANGFSYLFLVFPVLLLAAALFGGTGAKLLCLAFVLVGIFSVQPNDAIFDASSANSSRLQLEAFFVATAFVALFLDSLARTGMLKLPGLVLLVGWTISGWFFWKFDHERQRQDTLTFERHINDAQDAIQRRMEVYIDALRGGVSLFAASDSVNRNEWRRFSETLKLQDRYPGVNGVGAIMPVREGGLDAFLERVRADGMPDYEVHTVPDAQPAPADPAGGKYFLTVYCEPQKANLKAIGLDIASENNRANAARFSRDYGVPRITAPIQLVQDGLKRPGFNLFLPIYAPDKPHDTVHERRVNFVGWVYAPFVTENFLRGVLGDLGDRVRMTVFDGLTTAPQNVIFSTAKDFSPQFEVVTVLQLAGQQFTLGWTRGPEFEHTAGDPLLNAITLASLPLLLAGLVMSLQTSRERAIAIADELTVGLRDAERVAIEARGQAEAANAAKSEFLATMSHEIRTPMNGVIGYADLLSDSQLGRDERQWVEIIRNSGRSLLSIINDILDFSKIEAGMLELERIPFDVETCTREVVDVMRTQTAQRGLELTMEQSSPLPERVLGDPTRFRQILLNLVSNALKFTEKGGVRIALTWTEPEGNMSTGSLNVSVSDTGIGIPRDKLDRLFHRFSQVDSSTTRRFGGTGLGLAICRHLVERMGGHMGVESTLGVGTKIWFDAPFEPSMADVEEEELIHQADAVSLKSHRVLIAEDVVTNQKLAATVLRRLGCEVEIANNGLEAVDKVLTDKFDIVYMDCQMPEMDGFEAAREIRRQQSNHVPIVALTASAVDGDRQRCMDAGMDDYITKPFVRNDFIRTLGKWCG